MERCNYWAWNSSHNGDIYVADGYGAQYILHYSSHGVLKNVFGGVGTTNANFSNAHGICIDQRDAENPIMASRQRNHILVLFG